MEKLITLQEAAGTVLDQAVRLKTGKLDFAGSTGRIIAEDVFADQDFPLSDKSSVDGYACRKSDIHLEMKVLEVIPAGRNPVHAISAGYCSKIMTGASVPEGADCVLMVEDTEITGDGKIRFTGSGTERNFRLKGEEIRKNDCLITKGTLIRPQEIAVLAMTGCTKPLVYNQAVVGIIATGDELVEPSETPDSAHIRNSNAWQLIAQVNRIPSLAKYYGIATDTEETLVTMIGRASAECDVVLLTGGVSMGDYDLVPGILEKAGYAILFKSIAVQPGRPTLFGKKGHCYVFGLPGNPVSTFTIFELLVRPFLYRLSGHDYQPAELWLPFSDSFNRKNAGREKWIPVIIRSGREVALVDYRGSAHIHALAKAGGLMRIPLGVNEIKKGELVYVRPV